MTHHSTPPRRVEEPDTQELAVTQQQFLLARAQLAAGRTESPGLAAARRDWDARAVEWGQRWGGDQGRSRGHQAGTARR
jgi:hypothetical protein